MTRHRRSTLTFASCLLALLMCGQVAMASDAGINTAETDKDLPLGAGQTTYMTIHHSGMIDFSNGVTLNQNGTVGDTPTLSIDATSGVLEPTYFHVTGNSAGPNCSIGFCMPSTSLTLDPNVGKAQGAYIGWNLFDNGNTGETDFINHKGRGAGGFYFFNTSTTGQPFAYDPPHTPDSNVMLMAITGAGQVGIGTAVPMGTLDIENATGTAQLCINGGCQSPNVFWAGEYTIGYGTDTISPKWCEQWNPVTGDCSCPANTHSVTGRSGAFYFNSPWDAYFLHTVCYSGGKTSYTGSLPTTIGTTAAPPHSDPPTQPAPQPHYTGPGANPPGQSPGQSSGDGN